MKKVDTWETERGQSEAGLVLKRKRDGRRMYSPSHKRAIIEQCLQPGVSVAGIALSHGINANLVRKWIVKHRRGVGAGQRSAGASAVLLPVAIDAAAARPPASPSTPRGHIVVALHGARIELVGAVDADALRTVLRVVTAVRL